MKAGKARRWMRLDNAAKIFPSNSNEKDPKVFRFSCELYEDVKPDMLQKALDKALETFTGYLTVLKHGFFWYYLEFTDFRPTVREDYKPVCSPLYDPDVPSLLFEVTYFKKRINLEMFHVLADGTGAVEFLKAIVCHYLIYAHPEDFPAEPPMPDFDSSISEKMADSFQKYYNPKKKKRHPAAFSYKENGARLSENRIKVTEGIMQVDKLLSIARSKGTTITVFLVSMLILSIHQQMSVRERSKPITIAVPVNLRNHFESETVRNFFSVAHVTYLPKKDDTTPPTLEQLFEIVSKQLKEAMGAERLEEQMNALISFEKNVAIRAVPLGIKDFALRIAYNISELSVTAAMSNVGAISLPDIYTPYVRLFDVLSSTRKLQVCMCSFNGNMVVTFTDKFVSSDIQKSFFRMLTSLGVEVEIATNPLDELIEEVKSE